MAAARINRADGTCGDCRGKIKESGRKENVTKE
jgi:hypothetical protein